MKMLKLIIGFLFLAMISACVDMEENIVINEDNSGVYSISIDMSSVMKRMSKMMDASSSEIKKEDKKDSTIYLKDLVMASDSLTAAEKELYKYGSVSIKSDEANEQMKIIMTCPFKKIGQLAEVKENLLKVLDKLKAFEKISGKAKNPEAPEDNGEMASKALTPGSGDNYKFTAEPGKIVNTILNIENYKREMLSDSTVLAIQQLTTMMGEMTYKTSITTPRDIKQYSGNNAELSGNKRMVIFKNTLTEMLEHPEKLAYKVEY